MSGEGEQKPCSISNNVGRYTVLLALTRSDLPRVFRLLCHGEQCVEVALFRHELVKAAAFLNAPVL